MGLDVYAIADHYRICTSSTRPSGMDLYTGLMIYETDTQITRVWNGSGWLPAGNSYPRTYQTGSLSGTTSGTTELSLGSLAIPAQPIATIIVPSLQINVVGSVNGDKFRLRLREGSAGGTVHSTAEFLGTTGGQGIPVSAPVVPFSIPADTATSLHATCTRITGTGAATLSGLASFHSLQATVLADWTVEV